MGTGALRGIRYRPIVREPIVRYRQAIKGVPLTGGQAFATIPGYLTGSFTVTSGAAFGQNVLITPAFGTYLVGWSVTLAGTLAAADANNFRLVAGGVVTPSVNPDVAGTYPQIPVLVTVNATNPSIQLGIAGNTPTTGSIYTGTLLQNNGIPGTATAKVGPQGLGNIWYPVQCTISTTAGAADTSTCAVYLGSQTQQNLQGGQSYAGGGDVVALSVVSMSPGDLLIAVWSGGVPGTQAAFNVQGTMDALGV